MKIVTAAIIINGKEVLIARRKKGEALSGYWEFPGGKLEDGETLQSCLKRELLEELGVEADIGEIVAESEYHYEHGSFRIVALLASIKEGPFFLNAHDKLAWATPSKILAYHLSPADIFIAKTIAEKQLEIFSRIETRKNPA